MTARRIVSVWTLMAAGAAWAQAPASAPATSPATSPATLPASAPAGKVLKFPGLQVDLARREIVLRAQVCRRKGPLELLVCRWGTKTHESIVQTKAKAAHLHAALLALGLTPGIPAQWSGADDSARFLPPRGPEVKVVFRWKDKDGKAHEAAAADWLAHAQGKKVNFPNAWVFTGSEVLADGAYLADVSENGHVISVSNFPDAVIDVPFQSTSSDADLEFEANTDKIPDLETDVEVVITPVKDAEKSPFARALVEIDAQGGVKVEGKSVTLDQLTDWAYAFLDPHPKTQVIVRSDGKALVQDAEQVRQYLRYGGVRDFRDQFQPADSLVLPRTPAQLQEQMDDWAKRFARPKDYIQGPVERAQEVLQDIQDQQAQIDQLRKLWDQYARQLRKQAQEYRGSTQPAGDR